jgi:hypothetical protein
VAHRDSRTDRAFAVRSNDIRRWVEAGRLATLRSRLRAAALKKGGEGGKSVGQLGLALLKIGLDKRIPGT